MSFLINLAGGKLRLFALSGALVIALLFSGAYYLRGQRLNECTATLEQIKALGALAEQSAAEAAKRSQEQAKDAERRRLRTLREIRHVTGNSAGIGAADFIGLLCAQGAAGCAPN